MTQCQSINEGEDVRFTVGCAPSVAASRGAREMKKLILNNVKAAIK